MLLAGCLRLAAFPPAPYYVIYGVVRDQVGVTLDVVDKLNSGLLMRNYEGFMSGAGKKAPAAGRI